MPDSIALFFDIGDTLAVPKLTAAGTLDELVAFPFVTEVLAKLHTTTGPDGSSIRLGIISNTERESLASMKAILSDAAILGFFEEAMLVFSSVEGVDKSTKEIFNRARKRAGVATSRCVYVGEDEIERRVASTAGFHVSFHPLHVFHVIGQLNP
jgi:FMN phosphatase YigB (HAD superfamily)